MNWTQPAWLYASVLVVPLALIALIAGRWHQRRLAAVFGPQLMERVLPASVRSRRTARDLGALVCLALGCLALAEPSFDKQIVQVKAKGVDLIIALDLSRSMDAQDVSPSRLERARREIVDLLEVVEGDRVGVVLFAGQAIGRLPLTNDLRAVQWVLDDASTQLFEAQGSDLGAALDVARELLSRDEGKAGKAVVVFSDGETHDPDKAIAAANAALEQGIAVYAVGIGDAPAPIPTEAGTVLRYKGERVVSAPDFGTLEEVARVTGGAYVKSEATGEDMIALYRRGIRQQVMAVERETHQSERWRSAYQVPLGIGFALWLGGAWLGDGRRRLSGGLSAVILMIALVPGVASASTPAEADALYRAEDYRGAVKAFERLVLERPGQPDLYQRLGAARYRVGDWLGAAQAWEQASRLSGGDADADFNAGNARWRAGQLEEAVQRYDRALGSDPDHQKAKVNRDLVAGELQGRRAVQPPPPPKEGDSKDEEGDGSGDSEQPSPSPQPAPGEEGEQSEGSKGEGEQDPSDAQADAQPGEGEPGEPGAEPGQGGEPGQEPGDPTQEGSSEGVSPDQLDGQPTEGEGDPQGGGEGAEGVGEAAGNITPAQAARLLDGVEEGQQRVRMVGRSSDKPW